MAVIMLINLLFYLPISWTILGFHLNMHINENVITLGEFMADLAGTSRGGV